MIDDTGEEREYELLNICEFNSTRKRMSAIFRMSDGSIELFCRGTDTAILEILDPKASIYVDATIRYLEDYASEDLRALCLATRNVPEEEY